MKIKKHLVILSIVLTTIFLLFNYIVFYIASLNEENINIKLIDYFLPLFVFSIVFLQTNLMDFCLRSLDRLNINLNNLKRWGIVFLITLIIPLLIGILCYEFLDLPPQLKNNHTQIGRFFFFFLPHYLFSIIIYSAVETWNTIENNNKLSITLAELQKKTIESQLIALQKKLNPHFLFNSLSVLSELIYQNPSSANVFINEFTKVYRYVLDFRDETLVTIDKELDFVNAFIYLQKIRFGKRLILDNQLDSTILNYFIPPFALQLLIENAIKHNEVSIKKPLYIKIRNSDNYIDVENNLQTRLETPTSNGIGLQNLIKTYSILNEVKPEIIKSKVLFKVRIPIIKK